MELRSDGVNTVVKQLAVILLVLASSFPVNSAIADSELAFTKLWSHAHATAGQVSEIPAFDAKTNTIWVAGVVGVDVLDADTGTLVQHIDVTSLGRVNSVSIHSGLAAFAIEAFPDRRVPGRVVFYDTRTRQPDGSAVVVGALPDMLTFTHDGRTVLVANEGTPNAVADTAYVLPDPPGTVSIIDVRTRTVTTAGFPGVPQFGNNLRTNTGMDFEPEYIAVDHSGHRAFVTLQDANGIAELDLKLEAFTQVTGLGAKDFSTPGNEIDPRDDSPASVNFGTFDAKGLYMPDAIAAYTWRGQTFLVMSNEGDFREDNNDRVAASTFGGVNPLDRLRVSNRDSSGPPPNLFAAGARSFSIRDENGDLVFDSGRTLDTQAHARGIYDDGRSRDKGVEPEGVALLKIRSRTYAFIGLERTLTAAVAIFDVTSPFDVRFVDMIVTPGDLSPEGLAAYEHRGKPYLAIANEVPAPGATRTNTTLYRLDP
jgi:hypothetical protein